MEVKAKKLKTDNKKNYPKSHLFLTNLLQELLRIKVPNGMNRNIGKTDSLCDSTSISIFWKKLNTHLIKIQFLSKGSL